MTNLTITTTATSMLTMGEERTVTARFKQPARVAHVNVPSAPWDKLTADSAIPAQYKEILLAVLDNAAKEILSKQLSAFSVWPSELDSALFCEAALIEQAIGNNSEWLTKEQIETMWRESATRKAWVTSTNYTANQAFRKAVAHYEALILKLAGKTSAYQPSDLDLILAKMKEADLSTELGQFAVRRIEALRNKPAPAPVDCDLL